LKFLYKLPWSGGSAASKQKPKPRAKAKRSDTQSI